MNTNLTEIAVILDRSGSMGTIKDSTIEGFNGFVDEQKKGTGEMNLTLVQFDTEYEVLYTRKNIQDVKCLEFHPRGSTALYDAIGRTINTLGREIACTAPAQRPGKVLVLIITDGEENASKEFTLEKVKEMITHQTDVYKWEFLFIGANQDAVLSGASLGIRANNTMAFTVDNDSNSRMYSRASAITSNYAATGVIDVPADQDADTVVSSTTSNT